MHIKRFEANNMSEALEEVKRVFGPDALILSSRTIRKERHAFGLFARERVEIQAASPRSASALRQGADRPAVPMESGSLGDPQGEPPKERSEPHRGPGARRDGTPMDDLMLELRSALRQLSDRQAFEEEVRGELRGLRCAMDRRLRREGQTGQGASASGPNFVEELMQSGLEWSTAEHLAHRVETDPGEGVSISAEEMLRQTIESRLRPPRPDEKPAIRVLVGAPGVGKTTTLAKLAVRSENGDGDVALVSMDPYRIGAEAQLAQYAALLDSPFMAVDQSSALPDMLERHPGHCLYVDTAGRSGPIEDDRISLQALRDRMGSDLSVEWVVDATARLDVMRAQLARFKECAPDRLILTKVDECEDLHMPLNLMLSEGCPPLSWMGNGQRVPEDLEMAEPGDFMPRGQAWLQ